VIHPIRLYGDPCLRRRARPVTQFDDALRALVEDMIDTMQDADGVGLAAPQIGVERRLFVMSGFANGYPDPEAPPSADEERAAVVVAINPVLVERHGTHHALEGCLSLPGLVYDAVPRTSRLVLRYQDATGASAERAVDGREAVVVQHEIDHLDGVLFIDRLDESERLAFMEEHRADLAEFQRSARAHLKELKADAATRRRR
jgi:peptide deformylase